jgi:tRNA dimethylallyltransferase
MSPRTKVLVLVGPTASGKTGTAIALAREFGAEIISADAVAVYRGFDIGSAKPSLEERRAIRHHLIDVADPDEDYTAARFAEDAAKAIEDISSRGLRVLVAGGTGLYVKALLGGLFKAPPVDKNLRRELSQSFERDPGGLFQRLTQVDPEAAARLQPRDGVRIVRALEVFLQTGRTISSLQQEHRFKTRPYRSLSLGLEVPREILAKRIETRTRAMLDQGLVEEVRGLLAQGVEVDSKPMRSIGYLQTVAHVRGAIDLKETRRRIIVETKRLAKRQMTWFRADPELQWLSGDDPQAFADAAKAFWEV